MDMLMKYVASLAPPVMIPFVTVIVASVEKKSFDCDCQMCTEVFHMYTSTYNIFTLTFISHVTQPQLS